MKYFILSNGGTGSRQAEMMVYLAAIGMLPDCLELKIYYVDADAQNGDTNRLQKTVQAYNVMRDNIRSEDWRRTSHGKNFMYPKVTIESWKIEEAIQELAPRIDEPKYTDIATNDSTNLASTLLDLMHPRFDQESKLRNGFYGDPAMGSAIFQAISYTEAFQNNPMFNELTKELRDNNGSEQCIVLTGSVFGGTGAALFPNFADKIRGKFPNREQLHIGGALMVPYFSFPNGENAAVTSADFTQKTAAALDYYGHKKNLVKEGQGRDYIFDAMWLSGYHLREKTCDVNTPGGMEQMHKPHFAELLSALMTCEFLLNKGTLPGSDEKNQQIFLYSLDSTKDYLDWSVLPKDLQTKMAAFARFSVVILSVVRGLLNDTGAQENQVLRGMFGSEGFFHPRAKCDVQALYNQADAAADFCRRYLVMMRELQKNETPQMYLFNEDTLKEVLNITSNPQMSMSQANRACNFNLLADEESTMTANDFTSLWQTFRTKQDHQSDTARMKSLYAEFYERCCFDGQQG